ncbi:MAG: YHS domain protein [Phycisphaeraceae bacterium]|nr:YHS domain protein [Phycisphaeraceae bacterium]
MNSRKRTLATTVFAAALSLLTFANFGHAQSMDSKTCDCHKQTDTMSNQPSRAYINAYNVPSTGIALEGYSPVSYFTEGKAQKGSPKFTADYNGVTYHFTSAKQVAQFKANPAKYEPAYGGWCALGMAIEDKLPVDPTLYKIVDGKNYLFLKNAKIDALKIWNDKNESQLIKKADAYWAKVSG